MVPHMPDRVRLYHTGIVGTTPEAWLRKAQSELRCKLSTMSNDKALSANALGRWEGLATHQARVEYHASIVVNALLHDAMTDTSYRVLGVQASSRHNAAGEPDHLICALAVLSPGPTVT